MIYFSFKFHANTFIPRSKFFERDQIDNILIKIIKKIKWEGIDNKISVPTKF